MNPEPAGGPRLPGPGRWLRKLRTAAIVLLITAAMVEGMCRAFWALAFDVPWGSPDQVLSAWYPGITRIANRQPTRDDRFFDVLILGGSVVNAKWGSIEAELNEQLSAAGLSNVRIYNFGVPGHTTRDSLLKYRALTSAEFDLVLVYHGINEIRANNVPPDLYRPHYDHYGWYELVNAMEQYQGQASWSLPLTLKYLGIRIGQNVRADQYVPTHIPREDWFEFGSNIRSDEEFASNLQSLLDLAEVRSDPVAIMTFAWYLADNYDLDAFLNGQLSYGEHRAPVEMWGRPQDVVASLRAHNKVVTGLAASNLQVTFVDHAASISLNAENFDDICHLTATGSARFANNVVEALGL